jgi:hypothetical protein
MTAVSHVVLFFFFIGGHDVHIVIKGNVKKSGLPPLIVTVKCQMHEPLRKLPKQLIGQVQYICNKIIA